MAKGDRLGRFDDDSVIYRADDPAQKVHWRRLAVAYVTGSVLAGLLIAGADRVLGQPMGAVAVVALIAALVVLYLVWRRRRNRRLTGSPTMWPVHGGEGRD